MFWEPIVCQEGECCLLPTHLDQVFYPSSVRLEDGCFFEGGPVSFLQAGKERTSCYPTVAQRKSVPLDSLFWRVGGGG